MLENAARGLRRRLQYRFIITINHSRGGYTTGGMATWQPGMAAAFRWKYTNDERVYMENIGTVGMQLCKTFAPTRHNQQNTLVKVPMPNTAGE